MKRIDINVGDIFGRLLVVEVISPMIIKCVCSCPEHNEVTTTKKLLLSGKKKSCNCLRADTNKARSSDSIVGQTFGCLTVLSEIEGILRPNGKIRRRVLAICNIPPELGVCGKIKPYTVDNLKAKNTVSCGECAFKQNETKQKFTKHGLRDHLLYFRQKQMMTRVYDPACIRFKTYSELYVEEFLQDLTNYVTYMTNPIDFPNWEEDVAAGKTIDRIDNRKGYERGNLRYIFPHEQNQNTSKNIWVFFRGIVVCFAEACRLAEIDENTARHRVDSGWDLEKALTYKGRRCGYRPPNYNIPEVGDIFFVNYDYKIESEKGEQ